MLEKALRIDVCHVLAHRWGHRPFYMDSSDYSSNDGGDQTFAARQRAALEDIFNQYKVLHNPLPTGAFTPQREGMPQVVLAFLYSGIQGNEERAD